MAQGKSAQQAALELDPRAKLEILGAILLALFLFALDQTVVGTALPVIVTDLHGNDLYVWVVTIYLLTSTISGPIYGKLSDLFGRRPIIIFAVSLFLIASVLAGLSQSMEQLILFRGLQGLGGGAIFPVALAVVADLYTPSERGKYLGLFGAVFGVSFLIGPAIGGLITDTIGWHWIFFVNVPIGLTNKGTGEWTDPAVGGLILAGLLITAVFIWIESRAADPIVPLGLFRIRNFSVSVTAMFFAAFGFFGAVIFLPRWLQTVGGASATISGYNLLPLVGGLIVSATMSGQIVARTGKYKILMLGSLVMLAVGLVLMTNLDAETPRPVLWFWMVIAGLGIGPSFAVFTLVVQNSVNAARIGVATASLTFFQQIGGTIGLTLAGSLLATRLVSEIPKQLVAAGVPQPVVDGFAGGGAVDLTGTGDLGQRILASVPPAQQPQIAPLIPAIVHAIYEAFSIAIAATFWVGVVGAVIAVIAVAFMREEPMRTTFDFTETADAAEPVIA